MAITAQLFLVLTVLACLYHLRRRQQDERKSIEVYDSTVGAGLTDPPSLHPLVAKEMCIGCGSCAAACPESNVMGLIHGKAELIDPTSCIGHGACRLACPVGAITLVFGTEKRGVDIPHVGGDFQTNVPGIFIAGELGGMGLIRNAIEQGRRAVESVRGLDGIGSNGKLDLVIVGAGPAGFSASLAAMQHKLRCVTVEQDTLGGTVAHYPRGKVVMTAPVEVPLVGKVKFRETTKEQLLDFWRKVERDTGVQIQYDERMTGIEPDGDGWVVKTARGTYQTRAVLLAIGRRGTPRKLGVPGEELNKVTYRLVDPAQYRGNHVTVVGGGDSALEAAHSLADESDTTVTLSYRSGAFSRAKPKNRNKVLKYGEEGKLQILLNSNVKTIDEQHLYIDQQGKEHKLRNDALIVSAGGILPTKMLKGIGIDVETKFGTE